MSQPASSNLPELLYIYDAYCGWCYGMSPVMLRVQEVFAGRLTVSVLSGGMVIGKRAEPIGAAWNYISGALQQVEQATGVEFGEAYKRLGEAGTHWQDSEPPARALYVLRQLDLQQRQLQAAHDIQHAMFYAGQDLNQAATYEPIVARLGLDLAEFNRQFHLPETAEAVRREFAAVEKIGVRGFPTAVLRVGSEGYVLARGFQPYNTFAASVEEALRQVGPASQREAG